MDLRRCSQVDIHTLKSVANRKTITSFNISDCYWLTGSQLTLPGPRASGLTHLDVRGSQVGPQALDRVLAGCPSLKGLYFTHRWPLRLNDLSPTALDTWSVLQDVRVVLTEACLGKLV